MAEVEKEKGNSVPDTSEKKALLESILEVLRNRGYRITKQRELILDVILDGDFESGKEIILSVRKKDPSVGFATVYRLVNLLDELGFLNRRNSFQISQSSPQKSLSELSSTVTLEDHSKIRLNSSQIRSALEAGLRSSGCLKGQKVISITLEDEHGMIAQYS